MVLLLLGLPSLGMASPSLPPEADPSEPSGGAPAPVDSAPAPARWLAAAEVGVFLTSRQLSFEGEPSGPTRLRGYSSGAIAGPWIHLEGFPLLEVAGDLLAGLGVFADFGSSVGLRTSVEGPAGNEQRASWLWQLGVGVEWRIRPVDSLPVTMVPALSYRWQSFSISPPVLGLPDSSLGGLCGSLRIEVAVASRYTILIGGGYVRWFGLADMVGAGYFTSGRAQALEASLGFGVAILGPLSLRAYGFYSGTWYSLEASLSSPYQATGATETFFGGRLVVRGTL
jgi:hypothetical protein